MRKPVFCSRFSVAAACGPPLLRLDSATSGLYRLGMGENPYVVLVVVDRSFGKRLLALPKGTPVWIVDTPVNRSAAERVWAEKSSGSHLDCVTTIKFSEEHSPEDTLIAQLETVDLHHGICSSDPPFTILEIIGANLTARVREALNAFGFNEFETTSSGFRATRLITGEQID